MSIKLQLEKLATENTSPCVTISMNTHRIFPEKAQDPVMLKNLLKEAEDRIIEEFGKSPAAGLLAQLDTIEEEIDANYNLDSLHIFLSNNTKEIIKSAWPAHENAVYIADKFNIRGLIKLYNRSEEYYLMLLSQSGVALYNVINDAIVDEIRNGDFPFPENRHVISNSDKGSDPKHLDDLVREYLNRVDKALVKIHNETGLNCVVICTEDNYSRLMQVADQPAVYLGYDAVDYNQTEPHILAKQAWEIVKGVQQHRRTEAIGEMKAAVAQGKVLTDLQDIYQAAIDGRGDVLIVHQDFSQAVKMTDDRNFVLIEDGSEEGTIEDITSTIAWEVLSKKGHVFFTAQDEIKDLGEIVLKTRY